MAMLVDDLRATQRSLRRSPGFAAAVIVTVALGVGVAWGEEPARPPLPPLIPRAAIFGNPEKVSVQLSPDGRWLATVGEAVVVWDLDAKPPVAYELAAHYAGDLMSAAFSTDSKRLVVGGPAQRGPPLEGSEGVVWLWELKP